MTPHPHPRTIRCIACLAVLPIAALAACTSPGYPGYYAGGNQASNDRYVYESTRDVPMSVDLRDRRTNQIIWTYDVPAGQQLVIDFDEGDGSEYQKPGDDIMRWGTMPLGTSFKPLTSSIQVPTATDRMLEPRVRKTVEVADQASSGTGR